jgi:hypothetical protein
VQRTALIRASFSSDRVMKLARRFHILSLSTILIAYAGQRLSEAANPPTTDNPWRALHVNNYDTDRKLGALAAQLPELATLGVNCIILEIDYGFEFQSQPELREGKKPITKAGAARFVASCRNNGMELVPEFQCLAHQSWKSHTFPLLTKYPELDLTPGAFPNNEGIYCREWDPMNPKTTEIAFALIDELIDAFDAKAFHVGMDEIFLLASPQAKSTKHLNPADVFANVVNQLHTHIAEKRGLSMLIWADGLIDGNKFNVGKWEGSKIGTAPAIDKIAKDIILCPWHYEPREHYETLDYLMRKGFRIMPTSWNNVDATLALVRDARRSQLDGKLVGHIFTTWSERPDHWSDYHSLSKGLAALRKAGRP